jgi:hypothetical protein
LDYVLCDFFGNSFGHPAPGTNDTDDSNDSNDKIGFFQFCPDEVKNCDRLRLSTICRMLQTPLFSSKMNALKEVSRLIDESGDEQLSSGQF